MIRLAVLAALVAMVVACGGRAPPTRYYDLAPVAVGGPGGQTVLVLEQLTTDDAYDDERIVYRTGPYRLDYYDYHRWSASPGVMIGNYLERALEHTGRFHAVVREPTRDATVILSGRVAAIEEVDVSKHAWEGHVVIELTLVDVATGDRLWSEQYDESQPLTKQTPEGLAEAISTAMARIVDRAAPAISACLDAHQAASSASSASSRSGPSASRALN